MRDRETYKYSTTFIHFRVECETLSAAAAAAAVAATAGPVQHSVLAAGATLLSLVRCLSSLYSRPLRTSYIVFSLFSRVSGVAWQ